MDSATRMRSNGGKARARKLSKEALSDIGRKGGEARAAKMTPAAKSKAARKAVKARWEKVRKAEVRGRPKSKRKKGGRVGNRPASPARD